MNSEIKNHNSLISSDLIYFQHMNPENKITQAWGDTFNLFNLQKVNIDE